MIKSDELDTFRKMLRLMQARLRGDVEQIEEEAFSAAGSGGHTSSNHLAENGTDAWDLDFSLRIVESDQEVLSEISVALKKIDRGTFGLCESCLEQGAVESKAGIPKARLRAIPYARNCVRCERKKEAAR